jgi:hypothetical protein
MLKQMWNLLDECFIEILHKAEHSFEQHWNRWRVRRCDMRHWPLHTYASILHTIFFPTYDPGHKCSGPKHEISKGCFLSEYCFRNDGYYMLSEYDEDIKNYGLHHPKWLFIQFLKDRFNFLSRMLRVLCTLDGLSSLLLILFPKKFASRGYSIEIEELEGECMTIKVAQKSRG